MQGLVKIKLYGSDTDLGLTFPTKTAVIALADKLTFELEVKGLFAGIAYDTEEVRYLGGKKDLIGNFSYEYKPTSVPIGYPSSLKVIDTEFGFSLLTKKYHYLDVNGYNLMPSGFSADKCISVLIYEYTVTDNGDGSKTLDFRLELKEH